MKIFSFILSVALGVVGSFSLLTSSKTSPTSGPLKVISGRASVIDGDSIRIGNEAIRLFGIDALEGKQTCTFKGEVWACGRSSRIALERAIGRDQVSCTVYDKDRYQRSVSICRVGETDLNEGQVRNGWAVAYTQYSTRYVNVEKEAHANNRGIWRSEFERPHDYRKRLKREQLTKISFLDEAKPENAECMIKGNIAAGSGNKIFHVSGQRDYDRTRVDAKKGERWFCSEDEAVDAGWRKAAR